jgi:hypothetical protein
MLTVTEPEPPAAIETEVGARESANEGVCPGGVGPLESPHATSARNDRAETIVAICVRHTASVIFMSKANPDGGKSERTNRKLKLRQARLQGEYAIPGRKEARKEGKRMLPAVRTAIA